MDHTEEQLADLAAWRVKKHLSFPREKSSTSYIEEQEQPKTFHFFAYNPEQGTTDLSHVSLKYDEKKDPAIFSVPLSFTKKTKTVYKQHDRTEFGFDVRAYLTPNNSPIYPVHK
ncbi:hypothetical protein TVAG_487190 [Trichomonas vaginalis G3]|uniref:Uncharacterized protein n=1 Tax=Trichomonas vaginalis (strain ATCC PRA-98 / G3) TaxID=412133 RepID=A2DZE7_TRIV3|nr:hypothetical protein TVAGG3_1016800 [Trichomonas vaginalis G3]EAY14276.1 hypothetical protein TVAG_487190 [Trichomonas vaginalis G3]KAI5491863.1 hypothetical protein TVAGG3_1016800 [Trichomonas vaginalis G3]|eukprot:XP_001326499.1 hypothetical protein [Trichomonas vaginalis G3]